MTVAISTARGSAPIPLAMERLIGTNNAVVAVFDIKLVKVADMIRTANNNAKGEAFLPSMPIAVSAIIAPEPVLSKAAARASVPQKRKIVCISMDL